MNYEHKNKIKLDLIEKILFGEIHDISRKLERIDNIYDFYSSNYNDYYETIEITFKPKKKVDK